MSARLVTLRPIDPVAGGDASVTADLDREMLARAAMELGLPRPKNLELASLLAGTPFPSAPGPRLYLALATILRQIYAVAGDDRTSHE